MTHRYVVILLQKLRGMGSVFSKIIPAQCMLWAHFVYCWKANSLSYLKMPNMLYCSEDYVKFHQNKHDMQGSLKMLKLSNK